MSDLTELIRDHLRGDEWLEILYVPGPNGRRWEVTVRNQRTDDLGPPRTGAVWGNDLQEVAKMAVTAERNGWR